MKAKSFFLILFSLFLTNTLLAQTIDSTLVRVETSDGNDFVGKIVSEDASQIVLETTNFGKLTIRKVDIRSRELVHTEQLKDGKLWFSNPQSTRYFWAPNAYGLKAGEAYYQNIYVLWNQFTFGITDNFSLGGGIIPTFLFSGPTPVFATAKLSIPIEKDKLNLGAGTIIGTVIGEDVGAFGLVYGLSTFGSPDNNVSVGFAYGFAGGDWADTPLINVSGLFRVSSRGYFITENYFIRAAGESFLALGLGGRWIIKKAALDFIFAIPVAEEMDSFIAFPLIGFTIPFGNRK
jgi:hypothetical protein